MANTISHLPDCQIWQLFCRVGYFSSPVYAHPMELVHITLESILVAWINANPGKQRQLIWPLTIPSKYKDKIIWLWVHIHWVVHLLRRSPTKYTITHGTKIYKHGHPFLPFWGNPLIDLFQFLFKQCKIPHSVTLTSIQVSGKFRHFL